FISQLIFLSVLLWFAINIDSKTLPDSVIVNAFEVDQNNDIILSSEHVCPQNYRLATDDSKSCKLCGGNKISYSILVKEETVQCQHCLIDYIKNSRQECVLCDNQANKVRYNSQNECRNPGCSESEIIRYNFEK
ncbi:MAG: hypothetical protein MHPSP_004367, partial [Paramarteilia canceri]